jgi:hypothetical protein
MKNSSKKSKTEFSYIDISSLKVFLCGDKKIIILFLWNYLISFRLYQDNNFLFFDESKTQITYQNIFISPETHSNFQLLAFSYKSFSTLLSARQKYEIEQ